MSTYHARAHDWNGRWWAITVTGLPSEFGEQFTQASKIRDIEPMARSLISDLLEVDTDAVELEVTIDPPAEVAEVIAERDSAAAARDRAMAAAAEAQRRVALVARDAGFTVRDTAALAGVTYGRVGQLLSVSASDSPGSPESE